MKVLVVLLCIVAAALGQTTIYARAIIQSLGNPLSGVVGTVLFSQLSTGGNVTVTVQLTGYPGADGPRGVHVHTFGDFSDRVAGMSAGGHWNPTNVAHGCPEFNVTRHYGDMGNWNVVAGAINQTKTMDLLSLMGVDSIIGRAVIVHNVTDDCIMAVNGNAGARLGMGAIGIINSTLLGGAGEASQGVTTATIATCFLQPTVGNNVTGIVYLIQAAGAAATTVLAQVSGITGPHGFHLHWFGDVSGPAGLATGGHFNPANVNHGIPPFTPRHLGDMGIINFYDAATGYQFYNYTNDMISLTGTNNVIGRAIHVHANSDDCVNPIGNGGARLAQCVIAIVNSTTPVVAFPAGVPTTQNGTSICATITSASTSASASSSTGTSSKSTSASTSSTVSTSASKSTSASPNSVAQLAFSAVLVVAAIMVASL